AEQERLAPKLAGVQTLYMEAQYLPEDAALAERHQHTTVEQGAALAAAAGVENLVLLHLSRRYRPERWPEFLAAARAIFPATEFPAGWLENPADGI
ncbi:MAG: ribonuclease, partial [Deinococcus sp.]|nr:ribonuclease [Deinococcus sp.]